MNIPNGFKLVPVEPTDEMIMAFITKRAIGLSDEYPSVRFGGNYQAMLAVAPAPPPAVKPVTMANVMRAYEYACDHPHKYLRGTSNWCAAVAWELNKLESPAPAVPQPIYDETSDRILVEKIISKRGWPTEKVNGFYADYRAHHAWSVCMEFSQARAKSVEVGHE